MTNAYRRLLDRSREPCEGDLRTFAVGYLAGRKAARTGLLDD